MSEPYSNQNQAQTQAAGTERAGRSRDIDAPTKGFMIQETIARVRGLQDRIGGISQQLLELHSRVIGYQPPPPNDPRRGVDVAPIRPDLHELGVAINGAFEQLEQLQEHVSALSRL